MRFAGSQCVACRPEDGAPSRAALLWRALLRMRQETPSTVTTELVTAPRWRAIAAALVLCAWGGCGAGSVAAAGIGAGLAADGDCREHVGDLLHCGLDTPDGTLADAEWDRFVDAEITPRFPAGLTVFDAHGQWRSRDGRIEREPSRVVEIVHADDADSRDALRALIDVYKSRYRQESVLRVRSQALACF